MSPDSVVDRKESRVSIEVAKEMNPEDRRGARIRVHVALSFDESS